MSETLAPEAPPEIPQVGPLMPLATERRRLTPINRRRLTIFYRHKRGFWSLCVFMVVFVIALFAEFIANDRPILASYKGEILFPIFKDYPDEKFGGFTAYADYRYKDTADEINAHGWMLWPPIRFSYRTVIYGTRASILFGLALTFLSSIVGVASGAIQGYFGGWTDLSFQRFIEVWSSLPQLYILIIVSSFVQPSILSLLVILSLFSWVNLVHVVRAEFFRARNFEYVRAARALGLSDPRIIVRHVLPNAMVATLTLLPFIMSGSVTALTALDFLGLGQPPGSPSLGELLQEGKNHLEAPWLALAGFFSTGLILSLLVFIGEGIRDAFDPRKTLA